MEEKLQRISTSILDGNAKSVRLSVEDALESGYQPVTILQEAMITTMKEVGQLYEEGEYYVPEMIISARAMKEGLNILRPLLIEENVKAEGTVIIGTVKGDLHDIGKNLVSMMLEGAGFEVIDLGVDVAPDKFIKTLNGCQADILALSALLTTTMTNMKAVIDSLAEAGVRDQVKVIVGGAPVTESYATQIGADGFAFDAGRAVSVAKALVGSK
jgi:5-methyltetrahydrofolate--homocysteine methyltransferase